MKNKRPINGLLLGLTVGVVVASIGFLLFGSGQKSESTDPKTMTSPSTKEVELLADNKRLKQRIAELSNADTTPVVTAEDPSAKGRMRDENETPDLKTLLTKLANMMELSRDRQKLARYFKTAGKKGSDILAEALLYSDSLHERALAAELLGMVAAKDQVPALAQALKNDPHVMVRRHSADALASIGGDSALASLRHALRDDPDLVVRVNSAYGVAQVGDVEGLRVLEETYLSPKVDKRYRQDILARLAAICNPASASLFRKVIREGGNHKGLMYAITAVIQLKDVSAIPDLQALAKSSANPAITELAKSAITILSK